jgi:hypothetical protein
LRPVNGRMILVEVFFEAPATAPHKIVLIFR